MFTAKKKSEAMDIINTIIGDNSKIEGVLTVSESTRVDGLLEGKILSENTVIIGEHGVIKGDIRAVEILVAGTVYGNLWAKQRIELTKTGKVLGDLSTKTLVVDEGASFKGNCSMEVMEERSAGAEGKKPSDNPDPSAEAKPQLSNKKSKKTDESELSPDTDQD